MPKGKAKASKKTQFKKQSEYNNMKNKEEVNTVETVEEVVEVVEEVTPTEDAVLDTEALIVQDFKDGKVNMRYLANKHDVTISKVDELVKDLIK